MSYLGKSTHLVTDPTKPNLFKGKIDQFKIYERSLT